MNKKDRIDTINADFNKYGVTVDKSYQVDELTAIMENPSLGATFGRLHDNVAKAAAGSESEKDKVIKDLNAKLAANEATKGDERPILSLEPGTYTTEFNYGGKRKAFTTEISGDETDDDGKVIKEGAAGQYLCLASAYKGKPINENNKMSPAELVEDVAYCAYLIANGSGIFKKIK